MALSEEAKQKRREYQRRWREKNRDSYNAYLRKWKKENPEKVQQHIENYWNRKATELERGENYASGS